MKLHKSIARILVAALAFSLIPLSSTSAAPSLNDVRTRVRILQEQAAAAGEAAQQAKVEYKSLTRKLESVQRQAAADAATVAKFKNSLGAIAREQYKNGSMSQSLELLFSSDPKLFLAAAGSLESVTRKQSLQLKQYSVAKQRLTATSLTVNDKLTLAKRAQARYLAQEKAVKDKLASAQKLLNSLSKAERARLAKLNEDAENADQKKSLAQAAKTNLGSGRGSIALRFSIKQIGDRYVYGAAGPTLWDCSGLTMRAFGTAGVSLPHSAAAQSRYGKRIALNQLKPGDLVFFGRNRYISHVGIYISKGQMVNAPRPGSRVKIMKFTPNFGSLSFYGARRI
ncbi:MAG: peptidoglycan endopeptidase [Actinobacteria bacterium]|nr:peptidoglycan endopeptidase [Actinomycetota bacterium]